MNYQQQPMQQQPMQQQPVIIQQPVFVSSPGRLGRYPQTMMW
jgi:hypothetical protein